MPRKLRVLSGSDVAAVLGMGEALGLVEKAFGERERGRVQMPPKSYLFFGEYDGDLRVMPTFLEGLGQAGVKLVNVHPRNPSQHDLPTVLATIALFSPATGEAAVYHGWDPHHGHEDCSSVRCRDQVPRAG